MVRMVWSAAAVLLAATMFAAQVRAGSLDELKAAGTAFSQKDYDAAERNADAAIKADDPHGDQLATAYFLRGFARFYKGSTEDGAVDMTVALKHVAKGSNLWVSIVQIRMLAYLSLKRLSDAAGDFVALANERPEAARTLKYRHLSRMVWALERKDEAAAFDVLKAMRDIAYKPEGPGDNPDYMSQIFVRLLVQRGDDLVAMLELSKILTADMLVEIRTDRRYASLWTKKDFDVITDPKEIAKRELAYASELAQRHPNTASVMTRHVKALRAMGQSAKAVDVAREALANPELRADDGDSDVEAKLWLRNELVYALEDLNRLDEMFAEMQPILKLDESKNGAMVSQLINFGEIMVELDRGAEGIKTARRGWNTASPLGKMFIHMVEVCANATTDKPAAEKALELLRKQQSENYAAMTQALLCMDRTGEAAELVKKRLSLPAERGAVIAAVQKYNLPEFVTPMRRKLMERYAKIIARPDIQAALQKQGRIESFPFVAVYWGNL